MIQFVMMGAGALIATSFALVAAFRLVGAH
jgi:hypothetical protein